MSNLAIWFKKHEQLCPSVETQLYKDSIDGKINSRPAAILITRNIETEGEPNGPLYDIVETVVSLAVHSSIKPYKRRSSSPHQTYELSEKYSLNPEDKIAPYYFLGEFDEITGDWWGCKYLRPSFDLHFDTNANTTLYLALRSDGEDLDHTETHPLWISINEICVHLTAASVCDWSHGATLLCDEFLDNPDLRCNPILFALALSAAAQHMVHAASNVCSLCKRARTSLNLTCRWEEWKAMFQEAEIVENVAVRNDALSAAIAMVTAEQLHHHLPMERERRMNTRTMSKQSNRVEILMANGTQKYDQEWVEAGR